MSTDTAPPGVAFRRIGEGALGPLIRAKDWSGTPIGPMSQWPQALRGHVSMILELPAPAIIFWGPEQTQLYNDGYAVIMGPRHPRFLGASYRECWPDTYPTIYPWMQRVLAGEVVEVNRTLIPVTRHGFEEEAFFTFTFSPLRDDRGQVGGILQLVTELTETVVQERRTATLRALAAPPTAPLIPPPQRILSALASDPADLPLAVMWTPRPGGRLELEGATSGDLFALNPAALDGLTTLAKRVASQNQAIELDDLQRRIPGLRAGPWPEPITRAMLKPISRDREDTPRGVLLLAASPRLRFDDGYREFFRRVAGDAATVFASDRERALAEQLALAMESGQLGSWRVDLRTNRIAVADRTAAFIGFEGALERPFDELNAEVLHPDDSPRVYETFRNAIAKHQTYSCEYRIRTGEGIVRWLRSWGEPAYDEQGGPLTVTGVTLDVTEEVEARKRIEALAADLSAAVRARDEFISIASHELKTPLTTLLLQSDIYRRRMSRNDPRVTDTQRLHELLETIGRQGRRLTRLVDDMLDVGRINAGRLPISRTRVPFGELVQETAERLRPEFDAAKVPLDVQCNLGLSAEVDRDRLDQVISNLMVNALRYGKRSPVRVTAEESGNHVRLTVTDGGPGIPPTDLERIFGRFERAIDSNEVSGLGLGLFIARQIVEAHGGKIWAESERGQGTRFIVELPVASG